MEIVLSTVVDEVKVFFQKKKKIIPFDSLTLNVFDSPAVSLLWDYYRDAE